MSHLRCGQVEVSGDWGESVMSVMLMCCMYVTSRRDAAAVNVNSELLRLRACLTDSQAKYDSLCQVCLTCLIGVRVRDIEPFRVQRQL